MGKRKTPTHRTPGPLSPFTRGDDAAERLAALNATVTAVDRDRDEPAPDAGAADGTDPDGGVAALAELSAVVGREVEDVGRVTIFRRPEGVPGVHQPKGWRLTFADGGMSPSFESHDLRREWRLNEVATTHWRRSPDLPRLTGEDGRRVIRLLHTMIESRENGR